MTDCEEKGERGWECCSSEEEVWGRTGATGWSTFTGESRATSIVIGIGNQSTISEAKYSVRRTGQE